MSGRAWGRDALRRLRTLVRPAVHVTPAPARGMVIEWNVPVETRDGTVLRANVFRPEGPGPFPVLMCAHPYDKDVIGRHGRGGRAVNFQYRLFPQPHPITFSDLTSWEAPDPAFWVAGGYAVVNADLRGGGRSEGTGTLFSDQEAQDCHDLIEWAGRQPWSTGRVGLNGVSYLAISQYKVAALRPPSLAAICPWEGFTDLYRDFARPGGVLERGFLRIWSAATARAARTTGDLFAQADDRPDLDDWYRARTPDLAAIEVPVLVCGSFSDHSLHSRGSFEVFRRVGSRHKWLYTHRGGKWSTYYGVEALSTQLRFFDHFLHGADNGWEDTPPVRIAVHDDGPEPVEVTHADTWPPASTDWLRLPLDAGSRRIVSPPDAGAPLAPARADLRLPKGSLSFDWIVPEAMDLVGPMAVELPLEIEGGGDALLFLCVRKVHADGREARFEGSYGYASDTVTKGWQRVAHRDLDPTLSTPWQPVHTHERALPLRTGEVFTVQCALLPQATRFAPGDRLRLEIRGRWHFAADPWRGQFPANYERSRPARCVIHTGGSHRASLLVGRRTD